jgi:hypothetical protein
MRHLTILAVLMASAELAQGQAPSSVTATGYWEAGERD